MCGCVVVYTYSENCNGARERRGRERCGGRERNEFVVTLLTGEASFSFFVKQSRFLKIKIREIAIFLIFGYKMIIITILYT